MRKETISAQVTFGEKNDCEKCLLRWNCNVKCKGALLDIASINHIHTGMSGIYILGDSSEYPIDEEIL